LLGDVLTSLPRIAYIVRIYPDLENWEALSALEAFAQGIDQGHDWLGAYFIAELAMLREEAPDLGLVALIETRRIPEKFPYDVYNRPRYRLSEIWEGFR
jgi:hypothetical protein